MPAQAGLIIIGGEGALVEGALACAALPYMIELPSGWVGIQWLMLNACLAVACWIGLAGLLREYRSVNETISSLHLSYIAINLLKHIVEGPLRDQKNLNIPSTYSLDPGLLISNIATFDIHWGFIWGIIACVGAYVWLTQTTHGYEKHVSGGNQRTASLLGLPTQQLRITACAIGGCWSGLAGGIDVAAVFTTANASVISELGYLVILVNCGARHQPITIIPMTIILGGFSSGGSLLQRQLDMPDASVQVLLGLVFVLIIIAESFRDRMPFTSIFC